MFLIQRSKGTYDGLREPATRRVPMSQVTSLRKTEQEEGLTYCTSDGRVLCLTVRLTFQEPYREASGPEGDPSEKQRKKELSMLIQRILEILSVRSWRSRKLFEGPQQRTIQGTPDPTVHTLRQSKESHCEGLRQFSQRKGLFPGRRLDRPRTSVRDPLPKWDSP